MNTMSIQEKALKAISLSSPIYFETTEAWAQWQRSVARAADFGDSQEVHWAFQEISDRIKAQALAPVP